MFLLVVAALFLVGVTCSSCVASGEAALDRVLERKAVTQDEFDVLQASCPNNKEVAQVLDAIVKRDKETKADISEIRSSMRSSSGWSVLEGLLYIGGALLGVRLQRGPTATREERRARKQARKS